MASEGLKLVRYRRTRRRPRLLTRRAKALLWLAALILGLRAALPRLALLHVRRTLGGIEGFQAGVGNVDFSLWRGAYRLRELRLEKSSGDAFAPLFYAQELEFAVDWPAFLDRRLAASLSFKHPVLNLVQGPTAASSQTGLDPRWQQRLESLALVPIETIRIDGGQISYRNLERRPLADLVIRDIQLSGSRLAARKRSPEKLPASIDASAFALSGARLRLALRADPGGDWPPFRLDASITDIPAVEIDDFLLAFGGFEAEAGAVSLFIEASSQDGKVAGFAEPVFDGLRLLSWRGRKAGAQRLFRNALLGEAGGLLESGPQRLSARIALGAPAARTGLVPAVFGVLREAFLRSLLPGGYFLRPL